MAAKRIVSLALFFAVTVCAQGKNALADDVYTLTVVAGWENTTENVERDFGIKIPLDTLRWNMYCTRHQSEGNTRLNLINILHENSSMPLCYGEDLMHHYAHIALYAEHTRTPKEREHSQTGIATLFLKELGNDALFDMRRYASWYMQLFTIREESARINSNETITCDNVGHDVELRQYALLAEVGGVMNVSDISFSISHTMHAVFISFLIPGEDAYITLVVYNRGISHNIKDDACALAKQIKY